jgi:CheY-like chemotaxis protein
VLVRHSQLPSLKILVVDDDAGILQTASANLEAEGHTVLTASSGGEALRLLDAHRDIDLLLTDIVMPGSIDGFDLVATATRRRPGLHVIYTSGYLKDEGVWEGTLLTKPWTIDDLNRLIADVCSTARSNTAARSK